MTNLKFIMLFTASLLLAHGVLGAETKYSARNYDRIPVEKAYKAKNPKALETFYGKVIKVNDVSTRARNVSDLLKENTIELRDGQIYYPEEIEFILQEKPGINKAPHERAPHEKAPHFPN